MKVRGHRGLQCRGPAVQPALPPPRPQAGPLAWFGPAVLWEPGFSGLSASAPVAGGPPGTQGLVNGGSLSETVMGVRGEKKELVCSLLISFYH